jgi:hypothetical protein
MMGERNDAMYRLISNLTTDTHVLHPGGSGRLGRVAAAAGGFS